MTQFKINFTPTGFAQYNMPNGFLAHEPACHALWNYYLSARNAYETIIKDPIVYEGEKDPEANFQQLFTSIALAYGVQPEHMVKYWHNIDLQCRALHLPKMPMNDKYRFNTVSNIKTQ